MQINILISTIDQRIDQIKYVLLNKRDNVQYIVSHQYTNEKYKYIPEELKRQDVIVSQIPGKGVSRSRNNVIKIAPRDIGLFSDDDVRYTYEDFNRVLKTFSDNPSMDVAIFKIKTPEGFPEYRTNYPLTPLKLNRLTFSVGTIEIAFRVEKIRENKILFDERFGAGKSLLIGSDESIFIMDCIKKGLNVWYYPLYIVQHPYESTVKSLSKYDKKLVSVTGALDSRLNGWIAIPKAFYYTLKIFPDLIHHGKNPLLYLKERLCSSLYILFTRPN